MKKDDLPLDKITDYLMTLNTDVSLPEEFEITYVEVEEGVELRCGIFTPENPKAHVVLVPGLFTLVMSWYKFLILMMNDGYKITYIESREKRTSRMDDPKKITERSFVDELKIVLDKLVGDEDYIIVGSSNGTNTIVRALSEDLITPKHSILVSPYTEFHVPTPFKIMLPVVYNWTWKLFLLPIVKIVVVPMIANKKKDPFQAHKYKLGLVLTAPLKLKWSLRALKGGDLWPYVDKLNGKGLSIVLVGAGTDPLHGAESTRKVSERIEGSRFIEFATNYDVHDKPLVDLINEVANSG